MDAAGMLSMSELYQTIFTMISILNLNTYKWPPHYKAEDKSNSTYIVVGAGTAGSIIANRLTEDPNVSVYLIEAGGDPRWETAYPSLFPFLPGTEMDWNYTNVPSNDTNTTKYHRFPYMNLPSGRALGGSSTIHHFYDIRGCAYDYDLWAKAAGDDSWTMNNLLPFFKKSERLESPYVLNSSYASYHGTDGLMGVTKETREIAMKYLKAFKEIGYETLVDNDANIPTGLTFPWLYISNGVRQSGAECFLYTAKDRPNLRVLKNTRVTKVLVNNDTKTAYGVECSMAGTNLTLYSDKETIISAGAFNTPQILMLSGIGPAEQLKKFDIPVIADLPVGQSLQDHVATILVHTMEPTNDTAAAQDPRQFPLPTFVGAGALDKSKNQSDYYTMNFICRNSPAALLQLSSLVFQFSNDVGNQLAEAGDGREMLFTVMNLGRPESTGTVEIQSSNPFDPPIINLNHLSNENDLKNGVLCVKDFIRVLNSTYFKSVGAKTFYFNMPNCAGLEQGSSEYWECYIGNMRKTSFHYSCSCRMPDVVDNRLRVKGIKGLRLGDASVMPNLVTGKINEAVRVTAEKLSEMIKEDNK